MLNRKLIMLAVFFVSLLAVSAVSAAENLADDAVGACEVDDGYADLSDDDLEISENLESEAISFDSDDEALAVSEDDSGDDEALGVSEDDSLASGDNEVLSVSTNDRLASTNQNALSQTVDTSDTVQKSTSWKDVKIMSFKIKNKLFKNKYKKTLNKKIKKITKKMKKKLKKIKRNYVRKGWHTYKLYYNYNIGNYKTTFYYYLRLYRTYVYNWVTGESYYE